MSLVVIRVTPAEAEQLLAYAVERGREGWYYGRKDYFERRHQSIVEILERVTGRQVQPDREIEGLK